MMHQAALFTTATRSVPHRPPDRSTTTMSTSKGKIAIIGSGRIGRSWAMVFSSGGYNVSLHDIQIRQVEDALRAISREMEELQREGLLRGTLSAHEASAQVSGHTDLRAAVQDAIYVQECVPEVLDIKTHVFLELEGVVGPNTVLASSSSAMPASTFTDGLCARRANVIIAHPVNPPYHMPLVELVPAPWTAPEVVDRACAILKDVGQTPVILNKEVAGFVQPRIQYALIQECLKLVLDDVISVEDIDKIVTEGLGMRYAFMGPFETIHLNAEGVQSYLDRYADMIHSVASESGPTVRLHDDPAMATVHEQLNKLVPLEQLDAKRQWRNAGLAALNKMRRDMDSAEGTK